jgi:integrase
MKQMESKVTCEDFVLSWRDLNPGRNRRNARRTEKLLARSIKVAELGRLGYFLDYCVNSGWLVQNSAEKVKVESRGRGEPKYGLNPGEYERVLNEANSWTDSWGNPGGRKAKEIQVMVQLLRWSGLRISDAAMLEESQVRKDGNRYTVVIERMEKTGNTVRVPIPQFVGDALQALPRKGMRNGKRYWFWTCAGEPDTCVNAWRNDIAKLIHSAQRPDERGRYHDPFEHRASTHTLRHTFACLALGCWCHTATS